MTVRAFAVYTTGHDPRRLYERGAVESLDPSPVRQLTGTDGRPLDLVVDVSTDRVLYTFRADRRTKATRRGTFVADCRFEAGDPFEALATGLRELDETDEWSVAGADDASFDLRALLDASPLEDGDGAEEAGDRLLERIATATSQESAPVRLSVGEFDEALQTVKTLYQAEVDYTIGVASGATTGLDDQVTVDVLLSVTEGQARSTAVSGHSGETSPERTATSDSTAPDDDGERASAVDGDRSAASDDQATAGAESITVGTRVAVVVLVGLVGFSLYGLVFERPVHPITSLGALGGVIGGCASAPLVLGTVPDRSVSGYLRAVRQTVVNRTGHGPTVIAAGAVVGFLFPKTMLISGEVLLGSRWVFGPVGSPSAAVPSVILYVCTAVAGAVIVSTVTPGTESVPELTSGRTLDFVAGVAVYATALWLATGLARPLWYTVIPAG
jgi:hypothetical protein